MKRYRLLKEIVDPRWGYPAGSVFTKTGIGENGAYTCGNFSLHPTAVENNTEWFAEIPDTPAPEQTKPVWYEMYPNPTESDVNSPDFNAVWDAIKGWDIQRQSGLGYAGASGSDVMHILENLRKLQTTKEGFVWTDDAVLEYTMAVATSEHPYLYSIENWKKFKASKQSRTPLFRTEDGVDIFEGDEYWYCYEYFGGLKIDRTTPPSRNPEHYRLGSTKRFSTKEAAESYVAKQSQSNTPKEEQPSTKPAEQEWAIGVKAEADFILNVSETEKIKVTGTITSIDWATETAWVAYWHPIKKHSDYATLSFSELSKPQPYGFHSKHFPAEQPKEDRIYTQEQLDKAIEDAFNAAREINYAKESFFNRHYEVLKSNFIICSKHKTTSDYLSSIKKQ